MARPTLYSDDIVKKSEEYLDSCNDSEDDDSDLDSDPDEELEPQAHGGSLKRRYKTTTEVNIPTVAGLAAYLRVSRETLYQWAKDEDKAAFSDIMERLGSEQENRLINRGLGGQYNPTITKLLLVKHGHRDGADVTSGGKPIKGNSIIFTDFNEADSE